MQDYSDKKNVNKKSLKIIIEIAISLGVFLFLFFLGVILVNYVILPLVIHGGGETTVPDVVGKPVEEAQEILKEYRLNIEITEEKPDSIYPPGVVIEQKPVAGKKVRRGRNVYVILSKGKEKVRVPNIVGLPLERGIELLDKAGLSVKKIDSVSVDTVEAGKIVAIHPAPDNYVKKGTHVYLTISKGTEKEGGFPMPNLLGLTLIEAKKVIEEDSLVLGKVEEVEMEGEAGRVILQSPNYGVIVFPGDTVKLFISKKP